MEEAEGKLKMPNNEGIVAIWLLDNQMLTAKAEG